MENLKIAIDGASGFIGSNLVRYFEKEYNVFALTRNKNNWRLKGSNAEIINFDVIDRDKVFDVVKHIRPDIFIHCAVFGGYHFETDPRKIIDTNIVGSINTIDACTDIPLFINTGSSSEYGIRNSPMKETDEIMPNTSYALTKAIITKFLHERGPIARPKAITLRLFSVYGYYEEKHRFIPYIVYSAIKKQKAKVWGKSNVRDFIFIEDVISAYELVIHKYEKLENGEIFNVGSGKQYTLEEVVNIMGVKAEWVYPNRPPEPNRTWQADIKNITEKLGWRVNNSIKEGLEKTKEWMKDNIDLYEDEKNDKFSRFKQNNS
ncbi:MAG: NAD(P)-dependent oxidoreductase [Thermoplasmata archaeon]